MSITEEQNIWYPVSFGVENYIGREGDYAKSVMEVSDDELVRLVQERAKEDGEWSIENGFVIDEDKMHKVIEWVSRPVNIHQCVEANLIENPTIDWICRELAIAAKSIGKTRG